MPFTISPAADDVPKKGGFTIAPAEAAPDPTEGNSFGQNALIGVGKAFADVGRGVRQVASKIGIGDEAKIQAEIDDSKALDAPLMKTGGGIAGNVAGNVALAAPTLAIPGAGTYAGATAVGGAMGALQPVAEGESRLTNTAIGGAAGAGGKLIGDKVGQYVAGRAANGEAAAATSQAQNSVRDTTLATAKDAGYVVPPTQANPSMVNRVLEGFSGKIQTGQAASVKNQAVTNDLARKALNIADDLPITKEVLTDIRSQAGKAYEALRGAGTITADKQYASDLAKVAQKYTGAAKEFPELANDEVGKLIQAIDKPSFSADAAVDAISILRDKAAAAYAKGDKSIGGAYRATSQAMEDAIERRLIESGDTATLKAFQAARTVIAKTYSVEKALNTSGNVNAQQLASQLKKGKPLSDELKTIAEFADQFPKAAQNVDKIGSTPGVSPLDAAVGVMTGGPAGAAWFVGRPATRAAILSGAYQGAMTTPKYGAGAGGRLVSGGLNNPRLRQLLPSLTAGGALELEQQ